MAAVVGSLRESRVRLVPHPGQASFGLVGGDGGRATCCLIGPRPRATIGRQVGGALAALVAFAGLWFGAGALRATQNAPAGAGGREIVYVARPGDTLWAIATRLDPAGDPVEVVATLAAELHGAALRPGTVLTVPSS